MIRIFGLSSFCAKTVKVEYKTTTKSKVNDLVIFVIHVAHCVPCLIEI